MALYWGIAISASCSTSRLPPNSALQLTTPSRTLGRSQLNAKTLGGRVMLLLDDDDELPALPEPSEAILAARLGSQGIEAIDAALVGHTRRTWLKVARVVFDGLRAG